MFSRFKIKTTQYLIPYVTWHVDWRLGLLYSVPVGGCWAPTPAADPGIPFTHISLPGGGCLFQPPLHQQVLKGSLYSFHTRRIAWSSVSGVPNLWDLMPDELRWGWCNNNRSTVHNKCDAFESSPNHPLYPQAMGQLAFMKLVPGAKKVGDHWSVWCL